MNVLLEPRQHCNHRVFNASPSAINGPLTTPDSLDQSNSLRQKHRKMPARYRLLYFNMRGRAELARLVFAAAGVEYEDVRFEKEDWPRIKPTLHFEQVPVLEVDGKQINQSYAIARFIAHEHGLCGRNTVESAECDMLVDTLEDMMKPIHIIYSEEDKEKRVQLIEQFKEDVAKPYLQKFEEYLNKYSTSGYLVGDELSWADLSYINCCSWLCLFVPTALDKYPKLKQLKKKVEELPRIAAWMESRPQTDF